MLGVAYDRDLRGGQLGLDGPEPAASAEVIHRGVGVGDAPANQTPEQSGVVGQQHGGAAGDVAALVDDGAPELTCLPEAVVRGVGTKHQEQRQGRAHQPVYLLRRRDGRPDVMLQHEERGQGCTCQRPIPDGVKHRAPDVEEVVPPVMRVVVDHGDPGTLSSTATRVDRCPGGGMLRRGRYALKTRRSRESHHAAMEDHPGAD